MTDYNIDNEVQNGLNELKERIYNLEKENTKLKLTLADYGISENEISDISDSEAICIKQLELLRKNSDQSILTEDDAKTFKIFNEQLLRLRGGNIGRKKKTPPGAQASEEELLAKARNILSINKK